MAGRGLKPCGYTDRAVRQHCLANLDLTWVSICDRMGGVL